MEISSPWSAKRVTKSEVVDPQVSFMDCEVTESNLFKGSAPY